MAGTNGLDYDKLGKGDVIPVERVEAMTDTKFGTTAYGWASMAIASQVEREMEARHTGLTVCVKNGNILLLDDEDAVSYGDRTIVKHVRGLRRGLTIYERVDVGRLGVATRPLFERKHTVAAAMYSALIAAEQKARLSAHQRTIPGLPE